MFKKSTGRPELIWLTVLLVLVILIQSACRILPVKNNAADSASYDPALISETFIHHGAQRDVSLFVPFPLSQDGVPVVFMLHGAGGDPEQVMTVTTEERWNELAFREKFIVVYPDGWNGAWHDCRADVVNPSSDRDDVDFILFLLAWLAERYPVDFERIYAAGHGNGGMMAFRLAMEASDVFTGVFSNAGPLPVNSACASPDFPVSIMYMAGTADPLVPFEGGVQGMMNEESGTVLSAEATVAVWLEWLDLGGPPKIVDYPEKVRKDGSSLILEKYTGEKAAVWFVRVQEGGHAWPGSEPFTLIEAQTNGLKNQDVNAADIAWDFFEGLANLK